MPGRPSPAAPSIPRVLLKAATIVLLGGWIYQTALRGPLVWDDLSEISQNPVLRDPHGLAKIWAGSVGPDYFPLKTSLLWFLWRAWGDDPAGYHALSLGLHLLNALLFWRLLDALGLGRPWIGGLLFVVHPLAVESVAWIAELKNTLSLALLLGAMIAYARYDQAAGGAPAAESPPSPRSGGKPGALYCLSLALFLLALLSKSSGVMLPFVILLHAWWSRGRIGRGDLQATVPFFGLSLLLGVVTLFFQQDRALARWTIPLHGPAAHLAVAGASLAFYLWKSLVPIDLHPLYHPWEVDPPSAALFLPWIGWAVLAAVLWSRRASWGRPALFGLGFFVLNLVPVLGFLPMSYMHFGWVADHFAYLPLLGLAGLAAAGAGAAWDRMASLPSLQRRSIAGAAAAVVLVLAWSSRADAAYFGREGALWPHVLQRNPDAWMAHIDFGRDLFQSGRYESAIEQDTQALRLRPDLTEAYYNRGSALLQLGRLPEAIANFERALQLQPHSPDVLTNLGDALARSDRLPEAIARYREALRIEPEANDTRAYLIQAELLAVRPLVQSGRVAEALAACEDVLRLEPENAAAHTALGNVLFLQGRLGEAVAQYEASLRTNPRDAGTRENLNVVRRTMQQTRP